MTSASDQFPSHAYFNPVAPSPFSPEGYYHNYPSYQPVPQTTEGTPQIINPMTVQQVNEVEPPIVDYQVSQTHTSHQCVCTNIIIKAERSPQIVELNPDTLEDNRSQGNFKHVVHIIYLKHSRLFTTTGGAGLIYFTF